MKIKLPAKWPPSDTTPWTLTLPGDLPYLSLNCSLFNFASAANSG